MFFYSEYWRDVSDTDNQRHRESTIGRNCRREAARNKDDPTATLPTTNRGIRTPSDDLAASTSPQAKDEDITTDASVAQLGEGNQRLAERNERLMIDLEDERERATSACRPKTKNRREQ